MESTRCRSSLVTEASSRPWQPHPSPWPLVASIAAAAGPNGAGQGSGSNGTGAGTCANATCPNVGQGAGSTPGLGSTRPGDDRDHAPRQPQWVGHVRRDGHADRRAARHVGLHGRRGEARPRPVRHARIGRRWVGPAPDRGVRGTSFGGSPEPDGQVRRDGSDRRSWCGAFATPEFQGLYDSLLAQGRGRSWPPPTTWGRSSSETTSPSWPRRLRGSPPRTSCGCTRTCWRAPSATWPSSRRSDPREGEESVARPIGTPWSVSVTRAALSGSPDHGVARARPRSRACVAAAQGRDRR